MDMDDVFRSRLEPSQTAIIVGGIIEIDGRYLLVQEAKPGSRGKWSLPAGHLEPGENILDGAAREIEEESGYKVELTGVCQIGNYVNENNILILILFTTKAIRKTGQSKPTEILSTGCFTQTEIEEMREQLRVQDLVLGGIDNLEKGTIAPLSIVQLYTK